MSSLLAAALEYAAIGWASFPISGSKTPLAGSHGYRDARTDPEGLRRLFGQPDAAGIAIATGASSLVVIDIDPRNSGEVTAARVLTGDLPGHPTAITPRGGMHHFFRSSVCSKIVTRAHALGPGVDVEASGGGVVFAVPTPRYVWALSPFEVETPHMPLWLWKLLPKAEPRVAPPRRPGAGRALRFTVDEVLTACGRLGGIKRNNGADGWLVICPAHADRHNSLSVGSGTDGQPLLFCFAGCGFGEIARAVEQLLGRGAA